MKEYEHAPLPEENDEHSQTNTDNSGTMVFSLDENNKADGEILTEKEDNSSSVKMYKPKAPKYNADPDSPISHAEKFDIDEILKNLGIEIPEYDPLNKTEEKKTELEDISSGQQAKDPDEKINYTKHFKLPKKQEKNVSGDNTRYFHLDESLLGDDMEDTLSQKRKNLMQNFRVLSKTQDQDQAIIETASSEKGGKSLLDSVDIKSGENIFEAVEKAKDNKESQENQKEEPPAVIRQKDKKQKKKQAIATGKNLHATLESRMSEQRKMLVVYITLLIGTFALTLIPELYPATEFPQMFFNTHFPAYISLHILILGVTSFVSKETLSNGLDSLRYFSLNYDTGIFLMTVLSLISNIVLIVPAFKGSFYVNCYYTICVIFALTIKAVGEYLKTLSATRSLVTVMKSGSLESIQPVENDMDAMILTSGIEMDKNTNVLYCAGVDMNENLVDDINENNNTQTFYTLTSVISIIFGVVAGAYFAYRNQNFVPFFTVLLSTICLCFPIMNTAISSLLFMVQNQHLNSIGAAATEYEGVRAVGKASAVTMDVSDLFSAHVSRFRRVRGASISQSDAAVFAAAALTAGKSIVAPCFESFIKELGIDLPEAEDIQYEERMGFSCWVAGRRVLVGNRQMLINHSISVPTEAEEKRHAGKAFAYYVVVEGETIATYLVDYKVIGQIRKISPSFNKTGLVLILTSKEASLNEKVVSSKLAIETASVKILTSKGTDIMTSYRRDKFMRISSGLICSKKNKSLLQLIISSHNLYTSNKLFLGITVVAQIMGLVLLSLSMLLNMSTFFNPITIVFLHLLWSVAASALCIRKLK